MLEIETIDKEKYGFIYEIYIEISKGENAKSFINKIEQVEISIENSTKKESNMSTNEENSLKEFLASTYMVDKDKIIIRGD